MWNEKTKTNADCGLRTAEQKNRKINTNAESEFRIPVENSCTLTPNSEFRIPNSRGFEE